MPLNMRTLARRGCHLVGSTFDWLLEELDTSSGGLRSVFENRIACGPAGPATCLDVTGPEDNWADLRLQNAGSQLRTTSVDALHLHSAKFKLESLILAQNERWRRA
jgi:hypothetical protein